MARWYSLTEHHFCFCGGRNGRVFGAHDFDKLVEDRPLAALAVRQVEQFLQGAGDAPRRSLVHFGCCQSVLDIGCGKKFGERVRRLAGTAILLEMIKMP